MPSLEDLNVRSEWVSHEFRVLARKHGWLIKKVGVESLFANRKGVLQYLQSEFTPIGLLLRSQADMILRGNNGLEMFEAKAAEDRWENVAVEAWQFAYLYNLSSNFGVNANYVFGWPENDVLVGVITPVITLPVTRFYSPPRFKRWDNWLRISLEQLIAQYCPNVEMRDLQDGHSGSGDPYLICPKTKLDTFTTISEWLNGKGQQMLPSNDQVSWEGKDQARRAWKSYRWSEWERIHKKGELVAV